MSTMDEGNFPLFILLGSGMFLSVKTRKLTLAGALAGGATGLAVYAGALYPGISMLAAFFISATLASSWKKKFKRALNIEEANSGRRDAWQVLANGSIAGICGILAFMQPVHSGLFVVMMASALSSATADTLSSELGNVYGSRFYNIITFRKDARGLDGVISLEGTLCGLGGSILIAVIHALGSGWDNNFSLIVAAGTIGNISDSVIGAVFERRNYLNNNMVNFMNTLIASLAAMLLYQ